jgi:short-subunit dehydrogenase
MITGAAGGLGKAFAVECARRGWSLFLTDLRLEPLETLACGLRAAYGVAVLTRACDLTDPGSRAALFEAIHSGRLRFWALINVAGLDFEGPFHALALQQVRTILRLNVEGVLEMTHAMLSFRDPLAAFHILNVASLAAFYPMPVKATYAASKRFLLDFSLALREELRPMGVTVTALCPAGLPTTPACVEAIEAQGLLGLLTTQNVGAVAAQAIDAALRGRALVIPGLLNRAMQVLGGLLPPTLVARLVNSRWNAAHQKREQKRITGRSDPRGFRQALASNPAGPARPRA